MSYTIESNIPLPPKRTARNSYPLTDMKVGESFFLSAKSCTATTLASVYSCATYHKVKVTIRKVEGGYRVWRTE